MTIPESYSKAIVEVNIAIQKLTPIKVAAKGAKGASGTYELASELDKSIAQLEKTKQALQAAQRRYGF